jgi:hypothetical protein
MQVIGVSDVVDAIVERDIRSNRCDMHVELNGMFGEADASLMQLASEYYDEFHGALGVISNWKGARGYSEDLFDTACGVTYGLVELMYSARDKEAFLTEVRERHAGVAFSRMVAVGYMRFVLDDARA